MSLDNYFVWWAGRQAVVTLPAEIDVNNADRVSGELLRALDDRPAVLVVDMTATAFCGSAGIHALSRARSGAAAAGAGLRVAASGHAVRRVLELTGMDELLDVYPDVQAALAGPPVPADGTGAAAVGDSRPIADGQRGDMAAD